MCKVPLFWSYMCLDSKLLVAAEMFPSWPHENIPSPLKHSASAEKCVLLCSYKKHLSVTASRNTRREETCLVFQGNSGASAAVTEGSLPALPACFLQWTRFHVRGAPSFQRRGQVPKYPIAFHHCALAGIQSSSEASGRHPFTLLPAAEQGESCLTSIPSCFCLHRQRNAKRIPARQ